VNIRRNVWHGVLTPLSGPGLFAVVDRIGTTPNLEEYRFADPWTVAGA
jgi:ureidoglycolate lyase